MLVDFDVAGVERAGTLERRARCGLVAEQPVLGCLLNQCRDRVAARHAGCQPIIRIGGIERGGLLKVLHGRFKLAVEEELARIEIEFGGAPPVARSRLRGFFVWSGDCGAAAGVVSLRGAFWSVGAAGAAVCAAGARLAQEEQRQPRATVPCLRIRLARAYACASFAAAASWPAPHALLLDVASKSANEETQASGLHSRSSSKLQRPVATAITGRKLARAASMSRGVSPTTQQWDRGTHWFRPARAPSTPPGRRARRG